MVTRLSRSIRERLAWQGALIVLVCILLYWVGLGASGLSMSEGHRVVPAWEMIQTGDWWVPRMFSQAYLRKPPGIFWAIAGMSSVLGESEFAARSVSALASTLMALVAWVFATRWVGSPWGLAAGLMQACTPLFVEPGRSAEIEAFNNLCTQLACFSMLDLALRPRQGGAGRAIVCGLALAAGVLVKGPALAPAFAGAVCAGAWCSDRADRARFIAWVLAAIVLGSAVATPILWRVAHMLPEGESAVTQSPGEFLWDLTKWARIAMLPLIALGSALPTSIALFFPWRDSNESGAPASQTLRALRTCVLIGLLVSVAAGMHNARYTMPVLSLLAPLWACAFAIARTQTTWVWRCLLGRPVIAGAPLLMVSLGFAANFELLRGGDGGRGSGRGAGQRLARDLFDAGLRGRVELQADGMVEARPEVLLYAVRAAPPALVLVPRWTPMHTRDFLMRPGTLALIRTDEAGKESATMLDGAAFEWARGRVSSYWFSAVGTLPPGQ
jgi:4-amino-4-deoxy-L-arabinose transferase-like glycosyltransferase